MSDEKIDESIEVLEKYFFGDGEECGERLFLDFAKEYKSEFINSKISDSTENKFE